jgi:tetratricopeptide (TPR) repeat protein
VALLALAAGSAEAQERAGAVAGVKVLKYAVEAELEPERSWLRARAAVTLEATKPTRHIEFELNPHLSRLNVTDAAGRALEWKRSGRLGSPKLDVELAEPVSRETGAFSLRFAYEGALPAGPLDFITREGILLRDEARWYPVVDLSAFTAWEATIRVPRGWLALSSGKTAEGESRPEEGVFRHQPRGAVSSRVIAAIPNFGRDYACVATGEMAIRPETEPTARKTHAVCARALLKDAAAALSRKLSQIVRYYTALLGESDTESFGAVQSFPGQRGAIGFSAPGFMAVSEDVIRHHGVAGWAPEFLPHETAHQWFPIEVTLARAEDGWLAESLAEYLAWRYLAEHEPEQARLMAQRAMRDALEPEELQPLALGLRLFALEDRETLHQTLYQRGMLVWRTLETVIGRSRVDASLREYFRRHRGGSAGLRDFQKICEEISGRELGWFFDYFIEGTAIPELQLRRLPSEAPNEYLGELILKNVPEEFQVRVEMKFHTAQGPVEHSVATHGTVTPFSMNLPAPAQGVTLDPELRILRWTEAARRNRQQWQTLREAALEEPQGSAGSDGTLERLAALYEQILAQDAENFAYNEQQFRFQLGRVYYRRKQYSQAMAALERVLEAPSLEPMEAELLRAWARVYRARILRAQGRAAAARAEARAGLTLAAPALDTPVAWPETGGRMSTAREELTRLARSTPPAKK